MRVAEAEEKTLNPKKAHNIEVVVDRLVIDKELDRPRLRESLETALKIGKGLVLINHHTKDFGVGVNDQLFSEHFACPDCGISLPEIEPRLFSFNSPYGACQHCTGLGSTLEVEPELVIPNKNLTLAEGAIRPWATASHKVGRQSWYWWILSDLAERHNFSLNAPFGKLPASIQKIILHGDSPRSSSVFPRGEESKFEGVIENLKRRWKETESDFFPVGGAAFKPLLKEILRRLEFLLEVGLDYLTIDRESTTLAGGEAQRVRLATQIGSSLTGVIYVLDEPSIGLHSRDHARLIKTLKDLRDLGNTVLVVEHDAETMREANWIIDLGPGAGKHGGKVIFEGEYRNLLKAKTLTGEYLSGKKEVRSERRSEVKGEALRIIGASEHNLKNIDVKIPL